MIDRADRIDILQALREPTDAMIAAGENALPPKAVYEGASAARHLRTIAGRRAPAIRAPYPLAAISAPQAA